MNKIYKNIEYLRRKTESMYNIQDGHCSIEKYNI